eukprot:981032-Pleurochrysis_carterae.AAC.2
MSRSLLISLQRRDEQVLEPKRRRHWNQFEGVQHRNMQSLSEELPTSQVGSASVASPALEQAPARERSILEQPTEETIQAPRRFQLLTHQLAQPSPKLRRLHEQNPPNPWQISNMSEWMASYHQ